MKQTITLSIAAICFVVSAHAQINKGSILLGGTVYGSSSNSEGADSSISKSNVFTIAPALGFAVGTNTIFGFSLSYGNNNYKYTGNAFEQKYHSYGAGVFLRKYKLDELPQLYNVLKGDMSIVGPRPELRKYVQLYSPDQRIVLSVRPGITDYASIKFKKENDLLAAVSNPEQYYIDQILPVKLQLNQHYIKNKTFRKYFFVIWATISGRNNRYI